MELFKTTRQLVLEEYANARQAFEMETLPYHSTRQLMGTVVEVSADVAFLVFQPQEVRFFSYGLGDRIDLGPNQVAVTEADTNLAKGSSTNGATDFVIEGFGFHQRGVRIDYDGDLGAWTPADVDAVAAVNGERNIYDPGGVISPPQLQSPYNLEEGIVQHMLGLISIVCEWDRKRTKRLGIVDLMPHGGGHSMLRSNGLPTSENRYRVPEGLLWRRDGQPSSEFNVIARLERTLVVPVNLIALPGSQSTDDPARVYLELVMRVYGASVSVPTIP